MVDKVNYKFLSELEGGRRTVGYVPANNVSSSGVTIATGFDLGQRDEKDLKSLGLNYELIKKLKPYLGVKTTNAQELLNKNPLTITSEEARSIDIAVKADHIYRLKQKYNTAQGNTVKFSQIPAEAQTVLVSVSFQYGIALNVRTPQFWKAAIKQDWHTAIKELEEFGDAYPTRRKKEARLLESIN